MHDHHSRPSAKDLLQSHLLPLKMEDEQFEEVLSRTMQSTNSTRYQHLIDKLFSGDAPQLRPWSFYQEPADNKRDRPKRNKFSLVYSLLQQMVVSKLAAIFTRHGHLVWSLHCSVPVPATSTPVPSPYHSS
ncbi:hypothetical protein GBAR_LOCUS1054 [Geodia barretti]|uniref:Uncharacterized protein n=1 Tax=Geodia barretti TaxID=519541 RepID=A0AA35QVT6_GEOBA|nr:hypothetical protein GBAR_LOCUS1054 [Geodia barretti]